MRPLILSILLSILFINMVNGYHMCRIFEIDTSIAENGKKNEEIYL